MDYGDILGLLKDIFAVYKVDLGLVSNLFGDLVPSESHQKREHFFLNHQYRVLRRPPWLMPGKQTGQ